MMRREMRDVFLQSLRKLEQWIEDHDYKGYEPFDGLSTFLRPLTFGSLFLDRALMQIVRRSPVNIRPLLGIRPLDSTIGRGYMARGYLAMHKVTADAEYERKARGCLDWLIEHKSPGYDQYSWGKHFDFASRGGRYPKGEPITVWTSLIGMGFLEGYQALGDRRYLDVVQSICRWILNRARRDTEAGSYLAYTASGEPNSIHNHNMLAAGFLAGAWRYTSDRESRDVAASLVRYCCSKQHPDGGWYYGEEPMFHWIDNFHTGYNLDGLKYYIDSTGDMEFEAHLRAGLDFYMKHFFDEDGRTGYYHDRMLPLDSQCISQAIDTLSGMTDISPSAFPLAVKVADWAIRNMQDRRRGFFYYRRYRFIASKTPMLHWAQATTYRALASLVMRTSP